MIEIKDLLSRFDHLLSSQEIEKEAVLKSIIQATKIPIKRDQIRIKDRVVYLDIKPIYKNEVLLKTEKIFTILNGLYSSGKSKKELGEIR